jgi:hypothetical protein
VSSSDAARLPQSQPRDGVGERPRLESLVDCARLDGELGAERLEKLTTPRRRRREDEAG